MLSLGEPTDLQVMRNGIIRGALSTLIFFKKILLLTKNILNSFALSDVVFNTNSNNCYKLFKGLHYFAARKTMCKNIFFFFGATIKYKILFLFSANTL
jgi:hypothetical protein